MKLHFKKLAIIALIAVYLVIIAGAVVRMTGSGMGCPDWPKCFGYIIPPTEDSQLQWKPEHEYKKGQVIILEKSLEVAMSDFKSLKTFNTENWAPYTKHDYAVFNASHTWVEFINRLFGALAGLVTLVLAFASFGYWKKRKIIPILSWVVVFGMGFQAWLGATVVYSVLEPAKITVHMVMALVIVALLLYIIYLTEVKNKKTKYYQKIYSISIFALVITLIQIVLGTQVRQFVDGQIDLVGSSAKNLWLNAPNIQFYIHRSFSIAIVLTNLYLWYCMRKFNYNDHKIYWILSILAVEILSGLAMYYIDFPFASQPLHLVFASLLFGLQFYLVLETSKANSSHKTL